MSDKNELENVFLRMKVLHRILCRLSSDQRLTEYASHMLSMSEHGSDAIKIFDCLQAVDPMIEKLERALPCVESAIKLSEENEE